MIEYTKEEFLAEGKKLFGKSKKKWRFVCPVCGFIQTAEDLVSVGAGKAIEDVLGYWGYSCVGRWHKKGKSGFKDPEKKKGWKKEYGCDYTVGGLFKLHQIEVSYTDEDGEEKVREFFDFDRSGNGQRN